MENIIKVKDVSWLREGRPVLSNINWEVKPGEKWAVLGLNGSGKTTLLNITAGYLFPSSGEVTILGNVFGKSYIPDVRKQIGFVSSSLDRFAEVINYETIEEIIVSGKFASFGIWEEVDPQDWEKADQLIHRFRLEYLKGKEYQYLSQGEKRRTLIARALMNDPKLLILDEPCSGLDILSREELLEIVSDMAEFNCEMIYVTHHIEELVEGITHVLLLKDGHMIASGKKEDVVTDELLTDAFRIPVHIEWEGNRPWLKVKQEMKQGK